MNVGVLFPHQLYRPQPVLKQNIDRVVLIEEPLLFGTDQEFPVTFHVQKLVLHRLSMRRYFEWLQDQVSDCEYWEFYRFGTTTDWLDQLSLGKSDQLVVVDPTDDVLLKRLKQWSSEHEVKLQQLESPNFVTSVAQFLEYFEDRKSFHQTSFYQWQRKRLKVLLKSDGSPQRGQWTFDTDNRKVLPAKLDPPNLPQFHTSSQDQQDLERAQQYVQQHFSDNPGSYDHFQYPVTHTQAQQQLQVFLEQRFTNFGPYEDAISDRHPTQFHSVLTSALNIGLLQPQQVLDKTLAYARDHQVPINSLEGFVRQLIGWREYMRAVYVLDGHRQRTTNFFGMRHRLTSKWYQATTGLPPVDGVIKKVLATGYAHHIERLMIMGNCLLLCRVHPGEVYRWFMELFIDAYDWVMVPNVYAMSQFADGGKLVTKPYISSSNYLLKMADAVTRSRWSELNPDWDDTWMALFWSFLADYRSKLNNNVRMGLIINQLQKKSSSQLQAMNTTAHDFIASVTH